MGDFSRREFIRLSGGVTFLALAPTALSRNPFGSTSEPTEYEPTIDSEDFDGPPPIFTALPYIQPGSKSENGQNGRETMVIAWQTDAKVASFTVTFGEALYENEATVKQATRWPASAFPTDARINYHCQLQNLKPGKKYLYRVKMNNQRLIEGYFTTPAPRGSKIRFVSFGDNSWGEISDRHIAFQAFKAAPDFVMNTGDNVYESGLDNEYQRHFFPVYNSDVLDMRVGSPLLRSIPFYTVIGNHDVHATDDSHIPVADFKKFKDPLGYFANMYLPLNAPIMKFTTEAVGDEERIDLFKSVAQDRFPRMANYSFDWGDIHFLCLDSNLYVDPTDPGLQSWINDDLANTSALWKIVVYHHPAFNVGDEHYSAQHMRVLSPLFEKHNVKFALHGHEHVYQRTKPLKFMPSDVRGSQLLGSKKRLVPGHFTVDSSFDGKALTNTDGIMYITTGAGGKHLYDLDQTNHPEHWLHPEDNNVAYNEVFISDRHSLTLFEIDNKSCKVKQIDEWGKIVDYFQVDL